MAIIFSLHINQIKFYIIIVITFELFYFSKY